MGFKAAGRILLALVLALSWAAAEASAARVRSSRACCHGATHDHPAKSCACCREAAPSPGHLNAAPDAFVAAPPTSSPVVESARLVVFTVATEAPPRPLDASPPRPTGRSPPPSSFAA